MSALLAGVAVGLALALLRPPSRRPAHRLRDLAGATAGTGPGIDAARDQPARSRRWAVLAILGPGLVVAAGATPLLLLAGPTTLLLAAWLRRRGVRRLARVRSAAVVELVFALAAELRAGHPPRLALAAAAASSGALERPLAAATTASSGLATVDELRRVASLPGCRGLDAVAAAWEVTDRVGGPVADVLDRLGAAFDAEIASRETLDAILAGPRATMTLLAALPVVGVALGESIGAHPVRLLLHQPLGWALLGGAVAMDLAGVAWVAALSRRALRG